MKTLAFTLGCGLVTLLTAGTLLLAAALLLNQPEYTSTPAGMGRIVLFTPVPIPFTPQPVLSFSTVTPSISFLTASSATPTFVTTPTPTPTPTALPTTLTVNQAKTSSLATAASTTLPDRRPEAMGLLSKREGNRIFVSATPTVEVVITDDTVIYRDNSDMPQPGGSGAPGGAPPGDMSPPSGTPPSNMTPPDNGAPPGNHGASPGEPPTFQLEVERVDSLDEIGDRAMIFAWGEQQDNQVIAQIVVYHLFE